MPSDAELVNWFTYHAPKPGQPERYEAIRSGALAFARVLVANSPAGPDQTVALRKVREAVMTANQAIACSE